MKTELPLFFFYNKNSSISHVAVEITVNGKAALMIVDTGASNCVFDLNQVDEFDLIAEAHRSSDKAIGIGAGGVEMSVAGDVALTLSGIQINDYFFALIDMSGINEIFSKDNQKKINGIIGTDLLLMCNAIIDYRKKTLVLNCSKKILSKKPWLKFVNICE